MKTSMRECAALEPLLSAYVDHEANAQEMRQVEEHLAICADCTTRLRRLQRLSPILDRQLQGVLAPGEVEALRLSRPFRPPPDLVFAEAPGPPFLARLATVALALAIAGVLALVLLRTPPPAQQIQTGAPPPTVTAPAEGPVVRITIDGLVDPPTVEYVQRGIAEANQRHAALVVVSLTPSAGLSTPMAEVAQTLSGSSVPTAAYVPDGRSNATAETLAAATEGTIEAIPPQAQVLQMDLQEALWHRLLDPTTAYVLLLLGLYAVLGEISHPGTLFPGVTGAACLLAAGVAFLTLPTNWLGVLAVIVGVGLMGLELHSGRHGLLVLCGTLCLGLGSVVLFSATGSLAPMATGVSVAPGVLVVMVLAGLGLGLLIIRVARRIQHLPPIGRLEQLIGARGVARTGLAPDGVVHVQGQLWSAHSRGTTLAPGEAVRVVARHGLVLEVESANYRAAATQKGVVS
ncbi:MAG: zf-HC2 domain-containing protein [Chloroflexi bacterium]|nr:zf-HC2 domain-containing protein [Chloroflexota bacterium]